MEGQKGKCKGGTSQSGIKKGILTTKRQWKKVLLEVF